MQTWSSILKILLKEGWPLICVPIILFSGPFLSHLIGFYEVYTFLCIFPGINSLIAFSLYRHQKVSLFPVILSVLCACGFGSIFSYSVALEVLVPIFPHTIHEILPFFEKLELNWILISLSSPLMALLILFHLIKYGNSSSKKIKQEHAQGSARFATEREIKALHYNSGIPIGCLIKGKLSIDIDILKKEINTKVSQEIIRLNPHHMVLVAPSGAGKGVGIIIPTLLDYDGPVLVTDVKAAENFHVTSEYRKSLGREVYVLDPFQEAQLESDSINVLDFMDMESEEIVDEASMIASLLVPSPGHTVGNEKFFHQRARSVIQALILYVKCSDEIDVENKTLFHVYELLCQSQEDFKETLIQLMDNKSLAYGLPSRIAASLMTTAYEELSGTLNTARNELTYFDSPLMQKISTKTTIDLNKLIQNKADLYLCIPVSKLDSYGRIIRLIVSMTFSIAQRHRNLNDKPLLMVLDEMPLLGAIPKVEDALVVGRGYGVKILAVSQNIELIQKFSPHAWQTFLESNLLVFIEASGLQSSEYISKSLGQSTIEMVSKSKSENQQKGGAKYSSTSENQGESQSYQGRPILTSDEVRFLGDDTIIAFYKNTRPMLLNKIKYYEHPFWRGKFGVNPLEKI